MDSLDFLTDAEPGDATVLIRCPGGEKRSISNLNLKTIQDSLPLLAACFEHRAIGPFYAFEDESLPVVTSLLRYSYLHEYTFCKAQIDRPCSLLLHLGLYRLAEQFGAARLANQVRFNIIRDTELSCSTGEVVVDLCDGLRFLYAELSSPPDLKEIILNYCVSCFAYHGLGKSEAFLQTVFECPKLHKDLLRVNMQREFRDEGASEIMNLSTCHHTVHKRVLESKPTADFMCQLHLDKKVKSEHSVDYEGMTDSTGGVSLNRAFPLPPRPSDLEGESSGDETFDILSVVSRADSDCTIVEEANDRSESGSIGWSSESEIVAVTPSSSTTALLDSVRNTEDWVRTNTTMPLRLRQLGPNTGEDAAQEEGFETIGLEELNYSSDSEWSVVSDPPAAES